MHEMEPSACDLASTTRLLPKCCLDASPQLGDPQAIQSSQMPQA